MQFGNWSIATWRNWQRIGLALIAAAGVGVGAIDVANGAKPGGGGTSIPPGTIYFRHAGAMWQMDGAGTPASRVPLPAAPTYGQPSSLKHGGQRWFVYRDDAGLPGEFPKFPNDRNVLDIRAGSESGADALLLAETDIEVISEPVWAADDVSITFIGERWTLDPEGQPVAVDAGLYELNIDFAGGSPVAGELEFRADLSDQLRAGADGFPTYPTELTGHSWNSNRTAFAFGIRLAQNGSNEIWIVDLTGVTEPNDLPAGTARLLVSSPGVGWPEWSPDGRRIGYVAADATYVYDTASGRRKKISETPSTSWGRTVWSPTSAHLVMYHWDNYLSGYDAIFRFTADLGGKTELTAGLNDPIPHMNVLIPVGWRQ